ncbi:MAG TPA: hypothetical protein DCS43_01560 [Verrucomicrobia bacterium]|nr:hypothetical protein [Verrucomicrobiota bacterium]
MTCQTCRTPWTREQIQAARRAPLPALLHNRGLHLRESGAGNYRISEHPGIVIKQSYWRDPDTERGGNTIDFFETVLGMIFNQAMAAITH